MPVKLNIKSKPTRSKQGQKGNVQIGKDIAVTTQQHDALLRYLQARLTFGSKNRKEQYSRFEHIDREIACYLELDEEDAKRERDNRKGHGPKMVDQIIPLAKTQLDEALTFFLTVIDAEDGLYNAIAPKDQQKVAEGFAALMNEHATKFKHLRQLAMHLYDGLKYNIGWCGCNWTRIMGNKVINDTAQSVKVEEDVELYSGNELIRYDPYNFLYDISVAPTDLATAGEFFATPMMKTVFRCRMMANQGLLYSIDRFIDGANKAGSGGTVNWYKSPPRVRADIASALSTDWVDILSAGADTDTPAGAGIELVPITIWINPAEHGLVSSDPLTTPWQIWRFMIAENKYICSAEHMRNAHSLLPVSACMPWEDGFGMQTRSFAEDLIPYQRFASYQLNIHQRAARKALYGITFYNKYKLPELEGHKDDLLAGLIGINAGPDYDMRKAVVQFNDTPDTSNTLRDVEAMDGLMQKVLPTDILKQVASLDRATEYQAAATVQGANRRNLKIAKLLDQQSLSTLRMIQMYNIYQLQDSVEILNETGELIEINPSEIRDARIEFKISDGLKGLDRLAIVMHIKEIITTILQSQQAQQQIDIVAVIDYWMTLIGDNFDFNSFKFKSSVDALPPEQREVAFQLLQQVQAQQEGGKPGPSAAQLTAIPGAAQQ